MAATPIIGPVGGHSPYTRLSGDEIRLVRILPAEMGSEMILSCAMQTEDLSPDTKFLALSYVWGDTADPVRIRLNGSDFYVTRNLHEALLQLREWTHDADRIRGYGRPMPIWIDAICINQSNLGEKETHVPRMANIFGSALDVIAWLGPVGDLDPNIISQICSVSILSYIHTVKTTYLSPTGTPLLEGLLKPFLLAIIDILKRHWFRRIWILQEAVLARRAPVFMIGPYFSRHLSATWFSLMNAYHHKLLIINTTIHSSFRLMYRLGKLDTMVAPFSISSPSSHANMDEINRTQFGKRLGQAIHIACQKHDKESYTSTIPHDMIYGLLGIAAPNVSLPPDLAPNYGKAFTEVYTAYTRVIIESSCNLCILEGKPLHFKVPPGGNVPSWVRDFREAGALDSPSCRIPPSTTAVFKFSPNGRSLDVEGYRFGRVVAIYSGHLDSSHPIRGLTQAFSIFTRDILRPASRLRGMSYERVLDDVFTPPIIYLCLPIITRPTEADINAANAQLEALASLSNDFDGAYATLFKVLAQQSMLISDGSIIYPLSKNLHIQMGNELCIFKGSFVSHLLRPSQAAGEAYMLLGVCDHYISSTPPTYDEEFFSSRDIRTFHLV